MANGRLTNEERLIVLETEMKGAREDICQIDKKLDDFINASDNKYATKSEVSNLRKAIYFMVGGLTTFLVWALQEYLKQIGG